MNKPNFEALRKCNDSFSKLDFFGNNNPKCPHCGESCDVDDNEWYRINEDDIHNVTCPHCEGDFMVRTIVSRIFSTDEQEGVE